MAYTCGNCATGYAASSLLAAQYHLPEEWGYANDNVVADGQTVDMPTLASVNALHVLYAGDWIDGERDGLRLQYVDICR